MKEVQIKYPSTIDLNDITINTEDFNVTATIINEMAEPAIDINNSKLESIVCDFDSASKMFSVTFQLSQLNKGKYYRCCFEIKDKDGNYVTSEAALIDFTVQKTKTNIQLVPYEYFKDYVLNGDLNENLKRMLITYPRDGLMEWLGQAMDELELELELCFTKKTIDDERHDFYCDNLRDINFMIQTYKYPIISVEKYDLYYGKEKVCSLPVEELTIDCKMGTVEFLPTSTSPFFVYYQVGFEASQIALFAKGIGNSRLPNVFHLGYTHGIDFINLDDSKQADIRMAICRRALINALGRLSNEVLTTSEGSSVDGMSYSEGHAGLQYLTMLIQLEQKWLEKMKLEYNKHMKITVV